MATARPSFELRVINLRTPIQVTLAPMPTVCLLTADHVEPSVDIGQLVDRLVPAGCRHFMTWGQAADALRIALDRLLEAREGDKLKIATASHKGESLDDVAWFFVNGVLRGEPKLRCCLAFADEARGMDKLLEAVRSEVRTLLSGGVTA